MNIAQPSTPSPTINPAEPAPAPAAPPPPTPPPAEPSLEKLDIVDALLNTQRPKKKKEEPAAPPVEPTAPAAPAAEPAAPAAATPPAEPAAPAPEPAKPKRKPTPRPQPQPLSAEDAARIAAEAVKAAIPQREEPDDTDLPDDIRKQSDIYAELEKLNPEKYKGVMRKSAAFRKAETARADAWEAANPGKIYNSSDPDHAEWYAKNQPLIDPDDLEEARFEIRLRKRMERDIAPKLKEAERTIAQMRATPVAEATVGEFQRAMQETLDPNSVKSREDWEAWTSSNGIVAEVAHEIVPTESNVVRAASMLWDGVLEFKETEPAHTSARQYLIDLETELAQQEEPLVDNQGRRWVPLSEYNKLPESRRAGVFAVDKKNLVRYIGMRVADKVKSVAAERIKVIEKHAAKMGYVRNQPQAPVPNLTPQPPPQPQSRTAPLPQSPSVGPGEGTPPSVGTAANSPSQAKDLTSRFLGV